MGRMADNMGQVTVSVVNLDVVKDRVLSASAFEATCLACVSEVEQSRLLL